MTHLVNLFILTGDLLEKERILYIYSSHRKEYVMVPTLRNLRTVGLMTALCAGVLFTQGTGIVQAEEMETETTEEVFVTPEEEEAELLELDSDVQSRGIPTPLSSKAKMAACMKSPQCRKMLPKSSGGPLAPGTLSVGGTTPPQKWCARANPDNKFLYKQDGGVMYANNYGGRTRVGVYEIRNSWPGAPGAPKRGRPWVHLYVKPPSPGVHTIYLDSTPGVAFITGGKLKANWRETHNGKRLKPKYGHVIYPFAYNFQSDGKGGAKAVGFKIWWSPAPNQAGWSFLRGVDVDTAGC